MNFLKNGFAESLTVKVVILKTGTGSDLWRNGRIHKGKK